MILHTGDKLLVVHRRLFKDDQPRFFAGTVERFDSGLALVRGHTWVRDALAGGYYRKEDIRTKLLSLVSSGLFAYLPPDEIDVNHIKLEAKGQKFWMSDGRDFQMDLTEYEFHAEKLGTDQPPASKP